MVLEVPSVKDFGAVGDGATDDTDALQTAIDTVGGEGFGNELHFPLGRYLITRTLRVGTPLHLRGTGFGDVTDFNSNIMREPGTALKWNARINEPMVRFVAPEPNHTLHGGGIRGIFLDANDKASICLHVSSARESEFDLATFRPTEAAVLLDDGNGRLLDSVRIPRLVARIGPDAAAAGASGILIRGNQSGGGKGCTNVWMGDIDIEYDQGNGIVFEEVDTSIVLKLKGQEREFGSPGRAAVFLNGGDGEVPGVSRFPAQKNVIVHLARGKVRVEDQCIGNRILFWNSEGGGFATSEANFAYTVTDRQHGDTFQGGRIYPMRVNLDIPAGALQKVDGARDLPIGTARGDGVELPAGQTSAVRFSQPPPDDFNNGRILGVRVFGFPSVDDFDTDRSMRLTLEVGAQAAGELPSEVTSLQTRPIRLARRAGRLRVFDVRFAVSGQLDYQRGQWLAGSLRRDGDHPDDVANQGLVLGGLQLIYECDGPDEGQSGPWMIPRDQLE